MTGQVGEIRWYDVSDFGVEGKAWNDTVDYYDRLPGRAQGVVREAIWNLSRASAGMSCRFVTDAVEIRARWTLGSQTLGLAHFCPTGYSGVDLYGQDFGGRWRWVGVGKDIQYPSSESVLMSGMEPQHRPFMLYLPLYNSTKKLEIGVPASASFEPVSPRTQKPVAFYGTSIMQGASASRPGMAHTAILGRRLDMPVVNLGFSGQAKMEPELAEIFREVNASVFVIDPLPNMTAEEIKVRTEPFVMLLRDARPEMPIILVEDRTYPHGWIKKESRSRNLTSRAALRAAYERLLAYGVSRLTYVLGDLLIGADGEATVDGSHPTDLGFVRMADSLEPYLREALGM